LDLLLGLAAGRYSMGVREMCCRESLNTAFVPASENIQRLAQLDLSATTVCQIVEAQGAAVSQAQHKNQLGPDFTFEQCTDKTLITGMDGVMVPLVTEAQKQKRRAAETQKRLKEKRRSTARACRPRQGSDGPYKEFKIVAFYDSDKAHQYAVGTSGDHDVAGRLLRQNAQTLRLSEAQSKYSVSDGAPWILKQLQRQLPMLDENILDYYHFQEHVTTTGQVLFGEGSSEAAAWKKQMTQRAKKQGSLVMLDHLGRCAEDLTDPAKRQALDSLRDYVGKRIAMTDYPAFLNKNYDIGSGPTESFCGCLTQRLKGPGMRWDKTNAQALMALASLYYSNQWDKYWNTKRKTA